MSKTVQISEHLFQRLQRLGVPLVDTTDSVIQRLLDHYEKSDASGRGAVRSPEQKAQGRTTHAAVVPIAKGIGGVGLYLAPANEENLDATIINEVLTNRAEPHLRKEQLSEFRRFLNGAKGFHCWAMTRSSRAKFDKMRVGDWVLFTPKATGKFTYMGRVVGKLQSEELGNALWRVRPGLPWELIYFLDEVKRIAVSKDRLVTELGYDPGYVVPGVIRANADRVRHLVDRFGGIPELVSALQSSA